MEFARRFQTLAHMLRVTPKEELSSVKSERVVHVANDPSSHAHPRPVLKVLLRIYIRLRETALLINNTNPGENRQHLFKNTMLPACTPTQACYWSLSVRQKK